MAEKIVKPMTHRQIQKMKPDIEVSKGKWRFYLMMAGEELGKQGMEWEPPKNANILLKAAVLFWQKLFKEGDIAFFKELADRMDGKAPQAIALTDNDGNQVALERVVRTIIDPMDKVVSVQPHQENKTLQ